MQTKRWPSSSACLLLLPFLNVSKFRVLLKCRSILPSPNPSPSPSPLPTHTRVADGVYDKTQSFQAGGGKSACCPCTLVQSTFDMYSVLYCSSARDWSSAKESLCYMSKLFTVLKCLQSSVIYRNYFPLYLKFTVLVVASQLYLSVLLLLVTVPNHQRSHAKRELSRSRYTIHARFSHAWLRFACSVGAH